MGTMRLKHPSGAAVRFLLIGLFFSSILGLTSCTSGTAPRWSAVMGFWSWTRQNWSNASLHFLELEQMASQYGAREYADYARYGLVSVWLAQNELTAAAVRLEQLFLTTVPGLQSGIWYQAGVLAFRTGDYERAVRCFKQSLLFDPKALDAKINLELGTRALIEQEAPARSSGGSVHGRESPDPEDRLVFDLIRKKEQDRWKTGDKTGDSRQQPDY